MISFAFFGCWKKSGHYFFAEGGTSIFNPESEGLPADRHMDGSRLLLPYPEKPGYGAKTYISALDLTILSWWNRVYDTRGAVNSHVLARGDFGPTTMWNIFQYRFKEIAVDHTKPIIEVRY